MATLSRGVSRKPAVEGLTTGGFLEAEPAAEIGLINRAVAPDVLAAEVGMLMDIVAGKFAVAIRMGKSVFNSRTECPRLRH
ncbi:enoyl-CoA hydratase [Jannaschia seosinensis]|uniref:Enoyl-CoA hydratase n=1 Tax=Jannaschia seosinensis TaxID=313367 RepID=A0A0M7BC16_9RHOB|nr:hypothetical protein [Jannaschia seosinensis]CUH40280.1 enoyl-CoA hydratase [Jannaschia seosinensis]